MGTDPFAYVVCGKLKINLTGGVSTHLITKRVAKIPVCAYLKQNQKKQLLASGVIVIVF